jgi:transposase
LIEQDDGTVAKHQRSFGGFKRDLRDLVSWLLGLGVDLVVMESTGIYWKSVYAALEKAGIPAHVVNARQVKNVPGRKTDVSDSEWLAQLGRFGLVKPSSIPPQDLRELRLVSRYRQKLAPKPWPGKRTVCTSCSMMPASNWAPSCRILMAFPHRP